MTEGDVHFLYAKDFSSYSIRIRIDAIEPYNHSSKEEHTLKVYRSTTVHELRAMVREHCNVSFVILLDLSLRSSNARMVFQRSTNISSLMVI
jgi:hypothetical protein